MIRVVFKSLDRYVYIYLVVRSIMTEFNEDDYETSWLRVLCLIGACGLVLIPVIFVTNVSHTNCQILHVFFVPPAEYFDFCVVGWFEGRL